MLNFVRSILILLAAAAPGMSQTVNISGYDGTGLYWSFSTENSTAATFAATSPGAYTITWTNTTHFLGGKGLNHGLASLAFDFSTNYDSQTGSQSLLALYGWTTEPLVEYYITEAFNNASFFSDLALKGSVTSDGSVYDIYETQRVNASSIQGPATFPQYWSVRQSTRNTGTLVPANHFAAWAALGMRLGTTFNYQIMAVKSDAGSGSFEAYVEALCAEEWEQCGGIGWDGPFCCIPALVCSVDNEYVSQCLA
ncbi:family 11 glycosyl hydrolase [Mycena galericulata]|nr:family 11 glycosyl hydrolase [Mycena galericulata]